MKQGPLSDEIQNRMGPGVLTKDGFLGHDTRKLADIIFDDAIALASANLTNKDISDKMKYLTEKAKEGLGSTVEVDGAFLVSADEHKGSIPCPFGDNYRAGKANTTVTTINGGLTLTWSDLNIHMIEKHGFYEGQGSCYRLEPSRLIEVLFT